MRFVSDGDLDDYLRFADKTAASLLNSENSQVQLLREADKLISATLESDEASDAVIGVLFINASMLWSAGVRIALSGHTAGVFPVLRCALESAAYGTLMLKKPELIRVWLDRHESDEGLDACRKAFTFSKAIAHLKPVKPELHGTLLEAYQSAIDFGAHPNFRSIFDHVEVDRSQVSETTVLHTGLYGPTHIETTRGIMACMDFSLIIVSLIVFSRTRVSKGLWEDFNTLCDRKDALAATLNS